MLHDKIGGGGIIGNKSALDESGLQWSDVLRQYLVQSGCKHAREQFTIGIYKSDGAPIL
jgi:hypothetical protein